MRASRHHPLRVGLFAIVALAVLASAVVVVSGGRLFASTEAAELRFAGSVYGLQPGAPVVLRGVRVGRVVSVSVADMGGGFDAPVRIEIDRSRLAASGDPAEAPDLGSLVRRGLVARLATQSLLTGLLYVDLSLEAAPAPAPAPSQPLRIPTRANVAQDWQAQLQGVDFKQIATDVAAAAAAARALLGDAQLRQGLRDALAQIAAAGEALARTSARLDQRLAAVGGDLQRSLGRANEAASALTAAANQFGEAAQQVSAAAARAQGLLAADSPLLSTVRQSAERLGQSATALRDAAAADGTLMHDLDATLAEMRSASRAVREFAEFLERHPDSLLRGRPKDDTR